MFASFVQQRVNAVIVGADAFFTNRREQLVGLAARHVMPAIYYLREFAIVGGLISYGASITDAYHLAGGYTARISKAKSRPTCPFSNRQGLSWPSISRQRRRSVSPCRTSCSRLPTRSLSETARIHHAHRRRGCGLAFSGARAAAGQAADHRVPGSEYGLHPENVDQRFRAAAARTRLDRELNRRHRVPLGGGTRRAFRRDRG